MKSYFIGKNLTIPFKYVTCVQNRSTESQNAIYVHLMINSPVLYDDECVQFLEQYHAWLDNTRC